MKGSILEKLANSDPMYKRIQALDNTSLNIYEPVLLEKVTAFKDPYNQDEFDSIESAFKSFADQELSKAFKQIPESVQVQEKQQTDAPLSASILDSNNLPVPNVLPAGNHHLNPDDFAPIAETSTKDFAVTSVDPEQQLRLLTLEDEPRDPEVVWALEILDKLIAQFNSLKGGAQTCESRDISDVQNGTQDNSEPVWSTAKVDSFQKSNEYLDVEEGSLLLNSTSQSDTGGTRSSRLIAPSVMVTAGATVANRKEIGTQCSLATGDFDRATSVGSDEIIALPEAQQIILLPRSHQRGFRFLRFRRRNKERIFQEL